MRLLKTTVVVALLVGIHACRSNTPPEEPIEVKLYQQWQLQPGDKVGDREVLGSLGDITIALKGQSVYAPFDGKAQIDRRGCVIFSSPDVPGYLFRLCGLKQPSLGSLRQGDVIGSGDLLQFATLRKQPNNTWALVEPSKNILERTLKRP